MKYPMKYDIFGGMNIRRNPSYEQVTRGDEARFFFDRLRQGIRDSLRLAVHVLRAKADEAQHGEDFSGD